MADRGSKNKKYLPGFGVYLVAIILGSGASFFIASYWFKFTPDWIALLVGAVFSIFGAFLGENVGDAIIFTLIAGVLVVVFIRFGPEIAIVKTGIIPIVTGFCVGKLLAGIWREGSN